MHSWDVGGIAITLYRISIIIYTPTLDIGKDPCIFSCMINSPISLYTGADLNTLVDVLKSLTNWKQLAAQMSLRAGTIEGIAENCIIDCDRNYCNRRSVILSYCQSLRAVEEIQQVPCYVSDALDSLGKEYHADFLRAKFPSAKCIKKDTSGRYCMYSPL